MWPSSIEAEWTLHFFLWCQFFDDIQKIFVNDLKNIDKSLPLLNQGKLTSVLLYRSNTFEDKTNCKILIFFLQFIKDSHRFGDSLF